MRGPVSPLFVVGGLLALILFSDPVQEEACEEQDCHDLEQNREAQIDPATLHLYLAPFNLASEAFASRIHFLASVEKHQHHVQR